MVDYPNSNKAKKIFLCLFVGGGGGGHQVPKGLEGDVEVEVGDGTARFEKRRERERLRSKGKRKNAKDRDWIIKKKEVGICFHLWTTLIFFLAV